MASRLTIDRKHSFAGRDSIAWFFAKRKWIRAGKSSLVEAAWAKRSLPETEAALRFLILASKRSHKRAYDRNKIKRWLRAAVAQTIVFSDLELLLQSKKEQGVVMLRISKPIERALWPQIRAEIEIIAFELQKRA